jgi:Fe-S cluster assembly ATP-binding protein
LSALALRAALFGGNRSRSWFGMPILEIKNLHASVDGNEILKGVSLTIAAGETHAIMGPNGSGKSTLAQVLAGREDYEITQGQVLYQGQDLLELAPEDRARAGLFLAFQYPVEIPGVSNTYFLKAATNAIRKARGQQELDAVEFLKLVREKVKLVQLDDSLMNRPVNDGFSGGEKKRNEIFHMAVLEPTLAVLDETDSGLDQGARARARREGLRGGGESRGRRGSAGEGVGDDGRDRFPFRLPRAASRRRAAAAR